MITFKDTIYGDLTGQTYKQDIDLSGFGLESLEYAPQKILGNLYIGYNEITTLKHCPVSVGGNFSCQKSKKLESLEHAPKESFFFFCDNNKQITNQLEQIFMYQIRAVKYITDEGTFKFGDIQDQFNKYKFNKTVKSKGFRTLLGI